MEIKCVFIYIYNLQLNSNEKKLNFYIIFSNGLKRKKAMKFKNEWKSIIKNNFGNRLKYVSKFNIKLKIKFKDVLKMDFRNR